MPRHDEAQKATRQAEDELSRGRVVSRLAWDIAKLDPGPAAALRRGPLAGAGAAAFWKLTAEHAPRAAARNESGWAALIQAIAILTPKGTEADRKPAHEPAIPMGAALYDAGVSKLRLARLLAAPKEIQRDLALRLCRRLSGTEHGRFHLGTLASLILFGKEETNRKIARDYYSRAQAKDRAKRASDEPNGPEASSDA